MPNGLRHFNDNEKKKNECKTILLTVADSAAHLRATCVYEKMCRCREMIYTHLH